MKVKIYVNNGFCLLSNLRMQQTKPRTLQRRFFLQIIKQNLIRNIKIFEDREENQLILQQHNAYQMQE